VVGDDHTLPAVDELQRLDHDGLERLEERAPEAPRGCLAALDPRLQTGRTRPVDHELGIGQSVQAIEFEDAEIGRLKPSCA